MRGMLGEGSVRRRPCVELEFHRERPPSMHPCHAWTTRGGKAEPCVHLTRRAAGHPSMRNRAWVDLRGKRLCGAAHGIHRTTTGGLHVAKYQGDGRVAKWGARWARFFLSWPWTLEREGEVYAPRVGCHPARGRIR